MTDRGIATLVPQVDPPGGGMRFFFFFEVVAGMQQITPAALGGRGNFI